ncbi:MAG: hypothetical protein WAL50_03200 [Kineosporiaceae bacterium]
MGLGEEQRTPLRSSDQVLELMAQHARQAREDRTWERQMRRRQIAAGIAVLALLLGSITYVVRVRSSGGDAAALNPVSPSASAPAASADRSAASAPVTPSASPSASAGTSSTGPPGPTAVASQGTSMYGAPRSGLSWHSGIWTGGQITAAHTNQAGSWRGTPMDFATVYPAYGSWAEIRQSTWTVTNFARFRGRLSYGLPLLPKNRKGQWQDILNGSHDETFRGIARLLIANGHEDAAIRMGVEANGYWFPWAVTVDTVDEYRAAFRRIEKIMSAESDAFTFWVDLNCGTVLTGSTDRLAPLHQMYPGDDVVDGISMDHYNRFKLLAADEASWKRAIAPSWAPGLKDGVNFARQHGKGFAVSEWGLDGVQGPGDSPFFMQKMFTFFTENQDVLVYENYFSEPDPYIAGDLFQTSQNPRSAALYRKLWGRASD